MFILKYSRTILQCPPSLCVPVQLFAVDQINIFLYLETTGFLPPYTFCFESLGLMPALGQGGGRDGVQCVSVAWSDCPAAHVLFPCCVCSCLECLCVL